jgi:hypothetical protein
MAKAAKRRSKKALKNSRAKATKRGGTKQKTAKRKRSGSITRSKIKGAAKKTAKAAAVAAGLAAIDTVLTELGVGGKSPSGRDSDAEEKG